MIKVKDLKNEDLVGVKVRIPKKFENTYMGITGSMYIYSYWNAGIWFKKSMGDTRIYPLCVPPQELLNFTVVGRRTK